MPSIVQKHVPAYRLGVRVWPSLPAKRTRGSRSWQKEMLLPSIQVPLKETGPLCAQRGANSSCGAGVAGAGKLLVPRHTPQGRTMTHIVSSLQTGRSWDHPEGLSWGEVELCQGWEADGKSPLLTHGSSLAFSPVISGGQGQICEGRAVAPRQHKGCRRKQRTR